MKLENKILKSGKVNYRDLEPFQPDDFKNTTPERMEKLKTSLKNNGFTSPFYVWQNNGNLYTLDGHHRLRVMAELEAEGVEIPMVPAVYLDLANEKEAKKAVLLYNSHYADIDTDSLMGFVAEFDMSALDLELDMGDIEIDVRLREPKEEEELEIVIPESPKTKIGDVYELGPHKIICGDSTDNKTLEHLQIIDVVITDPPYAIFGSSTGVAKDIADDRMVRPFFLATIKAAEKILKAFGHAYIFSDWRSWPSWWEVARPTFMDAKNCIIWDKGSGQGAMYTNCYEMIGFFSKTPRDTAQGKKKTGTRIIREHASNVIRSARVQPKDRMGHNAAKPVDLLIKLIENSSDKGEYVADLFIGSGSTLIAAEQTGRICQAIEIEPKFVDVTIQRWVNYTGQTTIIKNGQEITWGE